MNLLNVLNEIETSDPAGMDKPGNRRDIFKQLSGVAGKMALTALPLGLSGLFQKAESPNELGRHLIFANVEMM